MNPLLAGKTAIITGAAAPRSIGLACARLFAAHGARLALLDHDETALEAALAILGDDHHGQLCDITDARRCREAVLVSERELGGVDILVNSAGLVQATRIMDISEEEYRAVLDTNLTGTFQMCQAVIPYLRERGGGAIVNISSIAGRTGGGFFGSSHYAAAKAGIFGFTRGIARELAPEGIRANVVAPGPIDNDFTRGRMTPEIKDKIAAGVPMGRLGTPEDIAGACLFLSSDLAAWVTGVVLDVNGGLLIH